jgi:hypothetical protein
MKWFMIEIKNKIEDRKNGIGKKFYRYIVEGILPKIC